MLHAFIVGMGRSGAGLHLPSLAKVRAGAPGLLAPGPVVVFDPYQPPSGGRGTVTAGSLEEAAGLTPPHRTVVHLCTPPHIRAGMLGRLALLGYRRFIVEKPLALDLVGLAAVARVRRRWGLDITVATHWLDSRLTGRLRAAVRAGEFGGLRQIEVVQNKPRFTRAAARCEAAATAFDIEVPHALAVVLTLAGGARISGASCEDMVTEQLRLPRLGRARLRLDHYSGVRTEIDSDLTSPVRERRITLDFERGTITGHYPCSEADHTAQLRVSAAGEERRTVFADDALPAFLRAAYLRYARSRCSPGALPVQVDAVRLLSEAKELCAAHEPRREEARRAGAAS